MRAFTVVLLVCVVVALPIPALAQDAGPPDVVGLTLPAARQRIEREWFPGAEKDVLVEPNVPDSVDQDRVIVTDQQVVGEDDPDAGQFPPTIALTVEGLVPDLLGLTVAAATEELARSGLVIQVVPEDAGDTAEVQEQEPTPGSTLPFGDLVGVGVQDPEPTESPTEPEAEETPTVTDTPEVEETPAVTDTPEVEVTDLPTSDEEAASSTIRVPLTVLLVLVVAALAVARWARQGGRRTRPATRPLRLRAHSDPEGQVITWVWAEGPGVAIRLEPHPDRGRQILEEAVHG